MTLQPTEVTCGPSCLHAIYRYHGLDLPLNDLIQSVDQLAMGGTFGVNLGLDAIKRGFSATIFSHNLRIFDPTWFSLEKNQMIKKLELQAKTKKSYKTLLASKFYAEFLQKGGTVKFDDLNATFLERILNVYGPILCGLSATYLYKSIRELDETNEDDDVNGHSQGHFVILNGINLTTNKVELLDPLEGNPANLGSKYSVDTQHFINSVLVGVLTYDANFICISRKA